MPHSSKYPNILFLVTLQGPQKEQEQLQKNYTQAFFFFPQNTLSSQFAQPILISFLLPWNHSICASYSQDNAEEAGIFPPPSWMPIPSATNVVQENPHQDSCNPRTDLESQEVGLNIAF